MHSLQIPRHAILLSKEGSTTTITNQISSQHFCIYMRAIPSGPRNACGAFLLRNTPPGLADCRVMTIAERCLHGMFGRPSDSIRMPDNPSTILVVLCFNVRQSILAAAAVLSLKL